MLVNKKIEDVLPEGRFGVFFFLFLNCIEKDILRLLVQRQHNYLRFFFAYCQSYEINDISWISACILL